MSTATDLTLAIQAFVRERLAGRRTDVVGAVEQLLDIARTVGEVRCQLDPDREEEMRFEFPQLSLAESAPLDRARGKLRMMCARLGVLCQERDSEVSLYGGEGDIERGGEVWHVCFSNTPSRHEFTISRKT